MLTSHRKTLARARRYHAAYGITLGQFLHAPRLIRNFRARLARVRHLSGAAGVRYVSQRDYAKGAAPLDVFSAGSTFDARHDQVARKRLSGVVGGVRKDAAR